MLMVFLFTDERDGREPAAATAGLKKAGFRVLHNIIIVFNLNIINLSCGKCIISTLYDCFTFVRSNDLSSRGSFNVSIFITRFIPRASDAVTR